METLPVRVELSVPHVQQKHHWDCGLACAQMVLGYLGRNLDDFSTVCKNLDFRDSVWTIDLALICVHYNVRHLFATVTLGVDKGYSAKGFYKSHFSRDENRVNELFENASSLGVTMEKRSMKIEEMFQSLSSGSLIITLVDWSFLSCKWCNHKCLSAPRVRCLQKCFSHYQGHFIVVCGYDRDTSVIYYKNPSYSEELCCSTMKHFDEARNSYGTDEDLIIVQPDTILWCWLLNSVQINQNHRHSGLCPGLDSQLYNCRKI